MKVRLRILLLMMVLVLASGCSTVPAPEAETVKQEKELIESVESVEAEEKDMVDDMLATPLNLETFGEALIAEGLEFMPQYRLASVVGALVGQAYQIGEVAIELYEYDAESAYLKDAAEDHTIQSKNGETVPVAINGRYLLILNEHEESEKILEIFNSFKEVVE